MKKKLSVTTKHLILVFIVLLNSTSFASCAAVSESSPEEINNNVVELLHPVIVLRGTSCSGKSSIARALKDQLSSSARRCALLEYDAICEEIEPQLESNLSHDEIDQAAALETLKRARMQSENAVVIVDLPYNGCNVREMISSTKLINVLIYTSPTMLLLRDEQRTQRTKRSALRQKRAREFIFTGFRNLYTPHKKKNTQSIDTISRDDLEQLAGNYEIKEKLVKTITHFELGKEKSTKIYPVADYDLIINSSIITISDGAEHILKLLQTRNLLPPY